jgi:lipopolysaccharide/colanic/teichoic acid biosynthesis glycosyltransferase
MGGAILLLIFSPLFLIAGVLITAESEGGVFFLHERLAKGGGRFLCYKFRTMYKDGDSILEEYLKSNPQASKEWEEYKKLREYDPRVTKVGKWLRKWSLDELPQLINVVKGEMSLVGPRPYLPREWDAMEGYRETILSVLPGITGPWQVGGRNELSFQKRLEMDADYVQNWSLKKDLILLMKTPLVVITGKGAC